jgi:hypothetical protein
MDETLTRCLDDLERRIDPADEERLLAGWTEFCEGRFAGDVFSPRRLRPAPPGTQWPAVSVNAALEDYEAMALQQFAECSQRLAGGDGLLLNVRCNYGTCVLPSLFGAELFLMDNELDTLPTCRPLPGADAIRRILEGGMPDLTAGCGARVLEMGERFADIARQHPSIGRHVRIYHPDLQGPLDVCELLWGSDIFYALYDTPELVHQLLALVTDAYAAFMRAWERAVPPHQDHAAHWGFLHRGRIMLRDDSATNLSAAMVAEFALPYDRRLLREFGGGAVHFCGRGDHFVEALSGVAGLHAVHVSQPQLNDMEAIFRHTVDKGVNLLGLPRGVAEKALARGRPLRGRIHCG